MLSRIPKRREMKESSRLPAVFPGDTINDAEGRNDRGGGEPRDKIARCERTGRSEIKYTARAAARDDYAGQRLSKCR